MATIMHVIARCILFWLVADGVQDHRCWPRGSAQRRKVKFSRTRVPRWQDSAQYGVTERAQALELLPEVTSKDDTEHGHTMECKTDLGLENNYLGTSGYPRRAFQEKSASLFIHIILSHSWQRTIPAIRGLRFVVSWGPCREPPSQSRNSLSGLQQRIILRQAQLKVDYDERHRIHHLRAPNSPLLG